MGFACDVLQAVNDHATLPTAVPPRPPALAPSRIWIFSSNVTPPAPVAGYGASGGLPCWRPHHFIDLTLFRYIVWVFHVTENHYTTIVLDLFLKELYYYDSIPGFAEPERDVFCHGAKAWLQTLALLLGIDGFRNSHRVAYGSRQHHAQTGDPEKCWDRLRLLRSERRRELRPRPRSRSLLPGSHAQSPWAAPRDGPACGSRCAER